MPSVHQHTIPFKGDAFKIFTIFKDQPHAFFLDSSLKSRNRAQFSYIGFDPFATVKGGNLSGFKKIFDKYRLPSQKLSFPAGAVGYLGYDGSVFFGLYDTILAIDHQHKCLIISSLYKSRIKDVLKQLGDLDSSFPKALGRIDRHSQLFVGNLKKDSLQFKSNFTQAGYIKAVHQALEHIRRGDIYQINLTHQIRLELPRWREYAKPAAIYKNLRKSFPSEFGAYFNDGRQVILSASPERFLKFKNGLVELKPMKGTISRGKNKAADVIQKNRLLKDPKEIAELLMVTDLERNDLGRVCNYATVKVKAMRTIEAYANVFQATSSIEGRLRPDCDQFDLLQATFPSGSVTGCPKIEAMKIIEKLEHGPRGLYTGALGFISFNGDMDFNVMIRTMFLNKEQISFHVGSGIVADSKPRAEWQETLIKAKPLINTLKQSFL